MKFSIGDKVIEKKRLQAHTSYCVEQVVAYLDGNVLATMWGDGFGGELHKYDYLEDSEPGDRSWRSAISRYVEDELCTPEEALAELQRLEASKGSLEEQFNKALPMIQSKLDKAAILVKEAAAIVLPLDKEFYDTTEAGKELFLALKEGGWSHSTMSCKYGR